MHPNRAPAPRGEIESERVTLSPARLERLDGLAELLTTDPSTARWWSSDQAKVAGWLSEPDYHVFEIVVDRLAGVIAFHEHDDPDYRFASLDIALFSPFQGRGLGPAALTALLQWLIDVRGHHRFHIDPAADNERAIRAYRKVGFKPVGTLRRYERRDDGLWHDGLLMDLLAEELIPHT